MDKKSFAFRLNTSILIVLNVFLSSSISSTFGAHVHGNGNSTKLCMNWYGILCRVTGKCCFNFIRNLESKRKGIHWLRECECGSEADASSTRELCKQRPVFSTWESQHKKRVVPCCVMRCCESSREPEILGFRTMKSTSSAVHLPTLNLQAAFFQVNKLMDKCSYHFIQLAIH